jgi:hypothetical protein
MPKEPQDGALDALPEFSQTTGPIRDDLDPAVTTLGDSADPSIPKSPAQPTTPTRNRPGAGAETGHGPTGTTSSPASSEAVDVDGSLEQLGAGLSHLVGLAANKVANRTAMARGHQPSQRWLMTDDEAAAIGGALGRLGANHVPEELESGDAGELLVIGSVAIGYTMRNLAGISAEDMARVQRGEAIDVQPVQPQPQQAPQAAQQPVDPFVPPQDNVAEAATQADPIIAQL